MCVAVDRLIAVHISRLRRSISPPRPDFHFFPFSTHSASNLNPFAFGISVTHVYVGATATVSLEGRLLIQIRCVPVRSDRTPGFGDGIFFIEALHVEFCMLSPGFVSQGYSSVVRKFCRRPCHCHKLRHANSQMQALRQECRFNASASAKLYR